MAKLFKNKFFLTIVTVIIFGITITLGGLYAKDRIEQNDVLTKADAVNFAVVAAGLSPKTVRSYEVRLRKADGHYVYRIVLNSDDMRYKYTIAANNGEVLYIESAQISQDEADSTSSDITATLDNYTEANTLDSTDSYINSDEEAISDSKSNRDKLKVNTINNSSNTGNNSSTNNYTPNNEAAASRNYISIDKVRLTTDDGIKVYDVEFRTGSTEYDYEINAKTGKIIEFSSEPIDDGDDD